MAQGLRVFAPGGSTVLVDLSDRMVRYYGTYHLVTPISTYSAFVSVAGMSDDGTWFVYTGIQNGSATLNTSAVYVVIGNGGFTWVNYETSGSTIDVTMTIMRI